MMPIGIVLQVPVSLNRLSAEYVQCICMSAYAWTVQRSAKTVQLRHENIIQRARLLTLGQAEETLYNEVSFSSKIS